MYDLETVVLYQILLCVMLQLWVHFTSALHSVPDAYLSIMKINYCIIFYKRIVIAIYQLGLDFP